ncbi:MAG: Crp/Fnr family transcriptional regulator [Hyphomonas sp.]|uniref:Crp/Fnr family transcriptional regulator n=1 Tax=Hyphomonas sp. TaxID=87 RepID=UPI0017DF29C1|nr:Crp/Fnr family transcriptional regulator [Hyphomonas sp.]MBA3069160.1 Crp/Fnr family transcriptional regulator [Hyphomonas sp.]MBU3921084.1 Crp/Fnr family transcriptional regulator [Alphaproteobacteria bacterium]MBU4062345.1 Crp/Fnr family transcriptional regulator [Alphaproteobacteria bacterium]MBU4162727.1 Crp/Fnr family transcriptional regulator [Alphaproteobacteria bacterium]
MNKAGQGVYSDMTPDEVSGLEAGLQWTKAPAGTRLIETGSRDTSVFLLAEGCARIARFAESGREISYTDVVAPCFIGDLAAMTGDLRSVDVTLQAPARFARLTAAGFSALLQASPALALGHIRTLSILVRDLSDRVFTAIAYPLHDRLVIELLRMARDAVQSEAASAVLDPAPSHYDISTRVGGHREAVTRALNSLARQGLVSLSRNRLAILDLNRLRALAPVDARIEAGGN